LQAGQILTSKVAISGLVDRGKVDMDEDRGRCESGQN
jgi:hypothetical protein